MPDEQAQFARIKTLIFDIDGVFTDGRVNLLSSGEQYRSFDIKDTYGVEQALKAGLRVAIISSAEADGVQKWLEIIKVKDVFMGGSPGQKLDVYRDYVARDGLNESEILYMGDDLPDCPILGRPGLLGTCPADAAEEVRAICGYVSPKPGGHGAVRDVVERVLKARGKWAVD